MIKNIFNEWTKKIGLKETEYFNIFLVILYIAIILALIPVARELLKSLVMIILLIFYFVPYLISNKKRYPLEKNVFWVNLFLGWTVIAWIILLIITVNYSEKSNHSKKKN